MAIFKQLANLNYSLSNALLLGEKERCEEVTEELQHAKKELIEIWVPANKLDVQVQNFLTGDGKLVNSSDRGKKIVDGEMFSLEERGEGRTQEVGAQVEAAGAAQSTDDEGGWPRRKRKLIFFVNSK